MSLRWLRFLKRNPKPEPVPDDMTILTTKLTKLTELLTEYVNCPPEFEDERMKYVTVQVDKGLLKEAKSLLGI